MENMREMLRRSLGRSLAAMPPLERLRAAWPVACGAALARRGQVTALDDGILRIQVTDPVWLAQMRGMQTMLEHELARIAEVKLAGIHFEWKYTSR